MGGSKRARARAAALHRPPGGTATPKRTLGPGVRAEEGPNSARTWFHLMRRAPMYDANLTWKRAREKGGGGDVARTMSGRLARRKNGSNGRTARRPRRERRASCSRSRRARHRSTPPVETDAPCQALLVSLNDSDIWPVTRFRCARRGGTPPARPRPHDPRRLFLSAQRRDRDARAPLSLGRRATRDHVSFRTSFDVR